MIEQKKDDINPEASSASKNFLIKGWEKFLKTLDDNKNKIGVAMILVGLVQAAHLLKEPSPHAITNTCVVLSLGIRLAFSGREAAEETTKKYE